MAGNVPPRFAPRTSAKPTSSGTTPAVTREMISNTIARLEWASQVSSAAIRSARTGSPSRDWTIVCRRTDSRRGEETLKIICRARRTRPNPIATRPRSFCLVDCPALNASSPPTISSGETQLRSNDRTWTTRVVPTSAPSMTARAGATLTSWRPAKEVIISAVAVLLCNRAVTPTPTPKAANRLRVLAPRTRRRSVP